MRATAALVEAQPSEGCFIARREGQRRGEKEGKRERKERISENRLSRNESRWCAPVLAYRVGISCNKTERWDARGWGISKRERESIENNYRRSDIHPGLYRVSGERLSTSRGCGDDITGKNPTFIIDVLVGAPCSTPSSIVAAYDGGALRQVASAIRDVCRLSTSGFRGKRRVPGRKTRGTISWNPLDEIRASINSLPFRNIG